MRKIKILFTMAALSLPPAQASDKSEICHSDFGAKILHRHVIGITPNYFMKVFGDEDLVTFGTDEGNRVMDINSGELYKAPGTIDPVPLLDGRTLMVPSTRVYDSKTKSYLDLAKYPPDKAMPKYRVSAGKVRKVIENSEAKEITLDELEKSGSPYFIDGLGFFPASNILQRKPDIQETLFDTEVDANYPSTGILSKSENESRVRVLANGSGLLKIRDYRINKKANGHDKITPLTTSRAVCEKHVFPTKTDLSYLSQPSLRKDGSELAAWDPLEKKMRIMKIGDGSKCEEVESLPFAAGKIDFSNDGRKLLFHVDHTETGPQQFANPGDGQTLHSYMYDRDTKKITTVNVDPNLDSFYPSFLKDGRVVFFAREKKDPEKRIYVYVAKLKNEADDIEASACADGSCRKEGKALMSLLAIGKLYEKICDERPASARNSDGGLMAALSLAPKSCRQMVKNYWEKYRKQVVADKSYDLDDKFNRRTYQNLRLNDLLAACPTK